MDTIARHKTAISRVELSRPIKTALVDGILTSEKELFDYGCGLGDDLRLLSAQGVSGAGWDPAHRPSATLRESPVVNLGYVINVIENPAERQEALKRAWTLAQEVLIVSARLMAESRFLGASRDYADGYLTGRGTFQKFFDQQELRNWVDQTLGTQSVPAAPGVFYVFRDEQTRSAFVASRYRRRLSVPRLPRSAELFKEHEQLLKPLMDFVGERGRLPAEDELSNAADLRVAFGSIRRAFRVVCGVTEKDRWAEITQERKQDLLIYLALSHFGGRPSFGRLSRTLQGDVKGLFGTYKQACSGADVLLYSLGAPGTTESALQKSAVGKLTPGALYVHESALDALSSVLRLFEGCARAYIGKIEGANIIKLHRDEPIVSYLSYPGFESDPHPALASSLTVHLQTCRVRSREYRNQRNPPVLHRKELFVAAEHPLYAKFARLTAAEERSGLYDETNKIGLREEWQRLLASRGLRLKGHRLLRDSKRTG